MRQPTPPETAYAWHRAALSREHPPIVDGEPQCGYFKRRLTKGGPWVPARIWLEQEIDEATGELVADEVMRCEVNGERRDPEEQWLWLVHNPIGEAEYDYLTSLRRWAAYHAPDDPAANPTRPLDPLKTPLPF